MIGTGGFDTSNALMKFLNDVLSLNGFGCEPKKWVLSSTTRISNPTRTILVAPLRRARLTAWYPELCP